MPKKLLTFQGLEFYFFYVGIFNSFLFIGLFLYFINWFPVRILVGFDTCCPRHVSFLRETLLFPALPSMDYILLILQVFLGICGLEIGILIFKSKQDADLIDFLFFVLGWIVRVFLRNLSGLLFFLSLLATPQASHIYVFWGGLSLFFIFWGQQGQWKGYSLNTCPYEGLPKLQIWGMNDQNNEIKIQ